MSCGHNYQLVVIIVYKTNGNGANVSTSLVLAYSWHFNEFKLKGVPQQPIRKLYAKKHHKIVGSRFYQYQMKCCACFQSKRRPLLTLQNSRREVSFSSMWAVYRQHGSNVVFQSVNCCWFIAISQGLYIKK